MTPTPNMGMSIQRLESILVKFILGVLILVTIGYSQATAGGPSGHNRLQPGMIPFVDWFGEQVHRYENESWEDRLQRLMTANLTNIGGTTAALKDRQLQCLAKNIYYESRGESLQGQVAVAKVTLTRLDEGYARTVCGVVQQRSTAGCQFEWVCKESLPRPAGAVWQQAVAISALLLHAPRGTVEDPTNGATHFHATYINWRPGWARDKDSVQRIGNHVFYRVKPREEK
jgi:spore germination cell wall hydrolase CwlJ-like protein